MNCLRSILLSSLLLAALACHGGDPAAPSPKAKTPEPAKTIFLLTGLECPSCVYMVQNAILQVPGVVNAEVEQSGEYCAKVSYDPKQVTVHQIAQAVHESVHLHMDPYEAVLKLHVAGYDQPRRAAQVKALFAPWKDWVELVEMDRKKGELLLYFQELEGALPQTATAKASPPMGWSLEKLKQALLAPPFQGKDLKIEVLDPALR